MFRNTNVLRLAFYCQIKSKLIQLTSAYASNLDDFITKHQPDFWIHGHIHAPSRYSIGKTEVICNPHGYLDDPDNGYDRELIIET